VSEGVENRTKQFTKNRQLGLHAPNLIRSSPCI